MKTCKALQLDVVFVDDVVDDANNNDDDDDDDDDDDIFFCLIDRSFVAEDIVRSIYSIDDSDDEDNLDDQDDENEQVTIVLSCMYLLNSHNTHAMTNTTDDNYTNR